MSKKTMLSGIQPSGRPHIGNYFGAMKQFVEMQDAHECFFMIADYHALNTIQDAHAMKQSIIDLCVDYLAIGIDPKKSVIFKQSDISEHTELAWIFDTITTMPYLMLGHAFKGAVGQAFLNKTDDINAYFENLPLNDKAVRYDSEMKRMFSGISVGLFNYPMLMASDILLYGTDIVPVGQDQRQHIEYTRDTAQKFNRIYDEVFKLPEAKILPNVAVVPGTDGRKMSKSYGNTIPLFAEDAEIEKLVMSIVTDSSDGIPKNVYEIHKLFRSESELALLYQSKAGKYKDLKEALILDIKTFIRPLREKRKAIARNTDAVLKVLKEGGQRAKEKASTKMDEVRGKVGVKLY